jgi:hypothetical protein
MIHLPARFAQVSPTVFRGAVPASLEVGEYIAHVYDIRSVVNLEWELDDASLWPPGVEITRIYDFEPLPLFVPSLEMEHVIAALRAIEASPASTYIHCHSGQNRTGVVAAAYRLVVLNDPIDAVIDDFKSYRGWWAWADEGFIRRIGATRVSVRRMVGLS